MFKIRNWAILVIFGLIAIIILGSDINVKKVYHLATDELTQDFNNGIKKLKDIHISLK